MKIRSNKQQSALALRRNASLEDAASREIGFSCQGRIGEFIDSYLRCDLFATRLQNFYQRDKVYKKTGLNTQVLSDAFQYFGLRFSKENILLLFQGGEGKRDKKSARQLRNGYLHELSEHDRVEILRKGGELNAKMNRFLQLRIEV